MHTVGRSNMHTVGEVQFDANAKLLVLMVQSYKTHMASCEKKKRISCNVGGAELGRAWIWDGMHHALLPPPLRPPLSPHLPPLTIPYQEGNRDGNGVTSMVRLALQGVGASVIGEWGRYKGIAVMRFKGN